jgi:hypothetical protein
MERRAASRCRLIVGTADKGLFLRRTKSPPEGGLDRTLAEGLPAGSCREAGTARALNGGRAPLQAGPPKVQISFLRMRRFSEPSRGSSKVVERPEGEDETDHRGQDQKF